jgi:hypothetical protein
LGGPACFHIRAHHLSWISSLTRLQDLRVRGCTKVSTWRGRLVLLPPVGGAAAATAASDKLGLLTQTRRQPSSGCLFESMPQRA